MAGPTRASSRQSKSSNRPWAHGTSSKLSADEYENGDTVVVLGHTDVKKGSQSAQLPVVHIWRFRGDDEVCRLQILTDTLQGARLLGKA